MVRTTGGIVAAGHEAVAEAGAEVLRRGGNAFDAVVACGFASAVAEPGFTSLAGGGFLLAHTATGDDVLVDFFVDTPGRGLGPAERVPSFDAVTVRFPAAEQVFHCGLGSVAVPGCLPGYLHAHRRFGRLALAEVTAPAVRLAERGVEVSATQAEDLVLLEPILARTVASRAIFFPRGPLLTAGDQFLNPDLAQFITEVVDQPDRGFASGPASTALVDQMAASDGGLVTVDDLAGYRVVERRPLRAGFAGHTLHTNPAPSFGGPLIALALQLLDQRTLPPAGSAGAALALVEVMAEVDRRRAELMAPGRPTATRGTTHITVSDDEGNVATMTTSNGECSGDVIPGTGVLLNNMLGEDDLHPDGFHAAPPGTRVASMMAPTTVLDGDGRVVLALGSGGSKRIRSAIVAVVAATISDGLDLATAVAGPRLHWDGDHVEAEPGLADHVLDALRERWPVNVWPAPSLYFGGVHAVVPGVVGVGDTRRGGAVRVV